MMAKLYWRVKLNGKWTFVPAYNVRQTRNDRFEADACHMKCESEASK